jgi:hypothetical protein
MPRIGPIRRKDFLACLRQMGFEGPFAGGKHQIMRRGTQTIRVPNPHRGDIGTDFWSGFFAMAASIA